MNKKGFTLVEVLAVITILAIISLTAVPNVLKIYENNQKEELLTDAKNLLSIAKEKVNEKNYLAESNHYKFYIKDLYKDNVLINDYNVLSYIEYSIMNDKVNYCIFLVGNKYSIGKDACVNEYELDIQKIVKNSE